ncbi:sodium-coupled monocarboxylate transporter 1-like [Pomacea canaliculata]|uniref:sodium-coupled monocarboxylate transporter 1-like n=1 Tax=Pomacea canaliculata TaxID=400727 RepID=UPI000D72C801|nr:sodium-coupled monocarboxylate transporter 1-like [Pomacea canaliculata]XP_025094624.1 sodium-coupled monocarboxylate transporter 1-like [Pomacea canaliculata]
MNSLHWLDYVVIAALMVVSVGIGIFFAVYRGGQKTKVEYLLGNRQMSMIPVCLSMFITFQSAISLIGAPADVFNTGTMYMFLGCGLGLAYIVGVFTVVLLIYPLHITSVYEYLELRFDSKCVRLLVTSLGMVQTILYMAVALYSPAMALQTAAGLPLWVSVAIVGGLCTLYTAVGGIKSVVWTDVIQTVVFFIGIGAVLVMGTLHVGGVEQAFQLASKGGRVQFTEITPDVRERHSMWSTVIGGCFMWLSNCFSQSSVQRISALKSMKDAKLAFIFNAPLVILYSLVQTLTGVLLYAYVVTIGCDPYQAGIIDNRNQMMPYFVPSLLGSLPGMPGLYMSLLFSGSLSTLSSGINALGANTVEDLLARPLRGYKDATVTVIAKITVLLYGGLTIGLAYLARSLRGPVTQLASSAFGACGGPVSGIFFMAGMVPWANKYGAIGGGVIGIVVNMWIAVGAQLYGAPIRALPPGPTHNCFGNSSNSLYLYNLTTEELYTTVAALPMGMSPDNNITDVSHTYRGDEFSIYDISYLWYGFVGFFVTFITGVIISFITGPTNKATLDPKLVFPFTRKLFRMKESSQEPEDTSNAIAMKTYLQRVEKFLKKTDTMVVEVVFDKTKPNH